MPRGRLVWRNQRKRAAAEKAVSLLQATHLFWVKVRAPSTEDAGHGRHFLGFQDSVGVAVQAATAGWVKVTHQRTEGDDQFLERMRPATT
jgi:hypothetical protein